MQDPSLRVIIVRQPTLENNQKKARNASPEGYLRARKIVDFFHGYLDDSVNALFASNYSSICQDRSKREYELLVPTSEHYNIPIEMPYCVSQYGMLAKRILSLNGTIIVAWEHHHIPLLLRSLYIKPEPKEWPKSAKNRYDLVFDVKIWKKDVTNIIATSLFVTTEGLGLPGDSLSIPKEYEKYNGNTISFVHTSIGSNLKQNNNCIVI